MATAAPATKPCEVTLTKNAEQRRTFFPAFRALTFIRYTRAEIADSGIQSPPDKMPSLMFIFYNLKNNLVAQAEIGSK